MAQDKNKKQISKKARKGIKGYPVATVAFYGPTNVVATKLVCGIIKHEDAEAEPMRKWFSESDVRKSEQILGEMLAFIEENEGKVLLAWRMILWAVLMRKASIIQRVSHAQSVVTGKGVTGLHMKCCIDKKQRNVQVRRLLRCSVATLLNKTCN